MDFFIGIAIIIAVFSGGVSLHEYVKRMGPSSKRDAKQILQELKALRAEMAELRESGRAGGTGKAGPDIVSRLDRLQEEMTALRDTSTKFDMSFDAALDRLEQRMERVEEHQVTAAAHEDTPQVLRRK